MSEPLTAESCEVHSRTVYWSPRTRGVGRRMSWLCRPISRLPSDCHVMKCGHFEKRFKGQRYRTDTRIPSWFGPSIGSRSAAASPAGRSSTAAWHWKSGCPPPPGGRFGAGVSAGARRLRRGLPVDPRPGFGRAGGAGPSRAVRLPGATVPSRPGVPRTGGGAHPRRRGCDDRALRRIGSAWALAPAIACGSHVPVAVAASPPLLTARSATSSGRAIYAWYKAVVESVNG